VVKDSKSFFFHPKQVLRSKGFEAEFNRLKKRPPSRSLYHGRQTPSLGGYH
jgi:hypothetical protein